MRTVTPKHGRKALPPDLKKPGAETRESAQAWQEIQKRKNEPMRETNPAAEAEKREAAR